jgi:hypothetical protein
VGNSTLVVLLQLRAVVESRVVKLDVVPAPGRPATDDPTVEVVASSDVVDSTAVVKSTVNVDPDVVIHMLELVRIH